MPNQVIPSIPSTPRCRVGRPRQAGTVQMRVPMQCVRVGRVGGSGMWWVGGQRGKHTEMSVCGCARPYARPRFRRQLCVPGEAGRAAPTKMASVPGTVATHPLGCFHVQMPFVAAIAQLGEHQTEDLKVPGSIPGLGMSLILAPGPPRATTNLGGGVF